jgi:branched-chain amino acid transport system substrate-binding protein
LKVGLRTSTWDPDDHRGTTTVAIYRAKVTGATDAAPSNELLKAGTIKLEKVTSIELPRKKEWLGW